MYNLFSGIHKIQLNYFCIELSILYMDYYVVHMA